MLDRPVWDPVGKDPLCTVLVTSRSNMLSLLTPHCTTTNVRNSQRGVHQLPSCSNTQIQTNLRALHKMSKPHSWPLLASICQIFLDRPTGRWIPQPLAPLLSSAHVLSSEQCFFWSWPPQCHGPPSPPDLQKVPAVLVANIGLWGNTNCSLGAP